MAYLLFQNPRPTLSPVLLTSARGKKNGHWRRQLPVDIEKT
jgi:hypothetical protein